DMFKVVSPIKADKLEQLLRTHPNRPFIESVLTGLREGFWPNASTRMDSYPITWDNSERPLEDDEHRQFVREHRNSEVAAERWSAPFGPDLMPGMYSSPIGVVPKGDDAFRLVVDHSAGEYSPNSMITKRPGFLKLDDIR
ncbi:hypothetical protein AURDEDRAFT_21796, partial [Auricularia subglabra TFB-10046 SS5]